MGTLNNFSKAKGNVLYKPSTPPNEPVDYNAIQASNYRKNGSIKGSNRVASSTLLGVGDNNATSFQAQNPDGTPISTPMNQIITKYGTRIAIPGDETIAQNRKFIRQTDRSNKKGYSAGLRTPEFEDGGAVTLHQAGGTPAIPNKYYINNMSLTNTPSGENEWLRGNLQQLDITQEQYNDLDSLRSKYVEYKAPLDAAYKKSGMKDLTPDQVRTISPNYYNARNQMFDQLGNYGYNIDTRGNNEVSGNMEARGEDAFGEINYNQDPTLRDRNAYVNKGKEQAKEEAAKALALNLQSGQVNSGAKVMDGESGEYVLKPTTQGFNTRTSNPTPGADVMYDNQGNLISANKKGGLLYK
jgi:hypothetical protein